MSNSSTIKSNAPSNLNFDTHRLLSTLAGSFKRVSIHCVLGSLVFTSAALGQNAGTDDLINPFADDETPVVDVYSEDGELPEGQEVNVGSFGEIDLHVKELDLTRVLQLLSIQSQRNIVASRNVAGTVSADLYGVDFYEALDAILVPNGFGFREKGNFIYVYTASELQALEDAERKPVTKIIRLNYMNAADAATFLSPLLSGAGSIAVNAEPGGGFQPSIGDGGAESFAHAATLVIRDYQENVDEIMVVLQELDTRPKQVLVESTILSARLNEDNAFGVDFALFSDLNVDNFTNPLSAVDDLVNGTLGNDRGVGGSSSAIFQDVNPTLKLGILGNDVSVFIEALDQINDTTILASPKMLVLNRQRADLLVGEKQPYLSVTKTETSESQSVEFLEVGTQLTVRPFVSDDGFIRMELRPSISSGESISLGPQNAPQTENQELTTNIMLRDGQTVVLGGLFKEETSIDRKQVPGLGDVPILGTGFKGQKDNVDRSEIIFLVKASIMQDEVLADMANDIDAGFDKVLIGQREGLLPWSRTKLTNSYMKDAMSHLEKGDRDMAMWAVNKALYLEPTMLEAMELKEELTGEKITAHSHRSIMDSAIDSLVGEKLAQLEVSNLEAAKAAEAEAEALAAAQAEAEAELQAELLAQAEAARQSLAEQALENQLPITADDEKFAAIDQPESDAQLGFDVAPNFVESSDVIAAANQPLSVDAISETESTLASETLEPVTPVSVQVAETVEAKSATSIDLPDIDETDLIQMIRKYTTSAAVDAAMQAEVERIARQAEAELAEAETAQAEANETETIDVVADVDPADIEAK